MNLRVIPLFPLPLVFFPGQTTQLRIFEPRYRMMLQDCMAADAPFGMVLARAEANGQEPPSHEVGTLAHIAQVERLPDDTFGITIYGGERFQICSFQHDRAYLQGVIDSLPLRQTETDESYRLHERLAGLLPAYLEALTRASGIRFNIESIPPEPEQLAFLTAIALQVNNAQKQALLGATHLPALQKQEIHLLAVEMDLMRWISQTIDQTQAVGFGTGGWLSSN